MARKPKEATTLQEAARMNLKKLADDLMREPINPETKKARKRIIRAEPQPIANGDVS